MKKYTGVVMVGATSKYLFAGCNEFPNLIVVDYNSDTRGLQESFLVSQIYASYNPQQIQLKLLSSNNFNEKDFERINQEFKDLVSKLEPTESVINVN